MARRGATHIPAVVVEMDGLFTTIAECDENLWEHPDGSGAGVVHPTAEGGICRVASGSLAGILGLQSALKPPPKLLIYMVSPIGFEPTAPGLGITGSSFFPPSRLVSVVSRHSTTYGFNLYFE